MAALLKYYLSGGAANADPNAALGGAISATLLGAGLHNLFDLVDGDEAAAGDVEYRCLYVKNDGASTAFGTKVFISADTVSTASDCKIGLGSSAINGVEQTVADEDTAPVGVTQVDADGEGAALVIGDIPAGEHKAVWVERTIDPVAPAKDNDTMSIRVAYSTGE
ncbi:MAG: hypothetical protein RPU39_00240 [Candidatus Sedimenticola sp. (ex Thyasira tokunagai)]